MTAIPPPPPQVHETWTFWAIVLIAAFWFHILMFNGVLDAINRGQ